MPQDRERKSSHLPGCLILYKLLEDPVGLGGQLGFRAGLFEVLTRQPKVEVLLTELCLQEGVEGGHPVWGGERRAVNGAEWGEEEEDGCWQASPWELRPWHLQISFPSGKIPPSEALLIGL